MTIVIYQKDASSHWSDWSLEFLHGYFPGDKLLSWRNDFRWPPYSLDLNPPNYFLWGHFKEIIPDIDPQTLAALKDNTRREIKRILADMNGRVIKNFNVCFAAVIRQIGAET